MHETAFVMLNYNVCELLITDGVDTSADHATGRSPDAVESTGPRTPLNQTGGAPNDGIACDEIIRDAIQCLAAAQYASRTVRGTSRHRAANCPTRNQIAERNRDTKDSHGPQLKARDMKLRGQFRFFSRFCFSAALMFSRGIDECQANS